MFVEPWTLGIEMVLRAGVEPARLYGQRILSLHEGSMTCLTERNMPIFIGLAVVKAGLDWHSTKTWPTS